VIIDLVVNHTSDQHPWFQAARRNDPKYQGYYAWRKDDPGDTSEQSAFPGKQSGVWQFDELAKAYYFHRFYSYQPDLNTGNPNVRDEIKKVMGFWLALGVSGFRVDAAPFVNRLQGRMPRDNRMNRSSTWRNFVNTSAGRRAMRSWRQKRTSHPIRF
jgi:maltose alpha-D-glucosyltransferase/alpha-amylase